MTQNQSILTIINDSYSDWLNLKAQTSDLGGHVACGLRLTHPPVFIGSNPLEDTEQSSKSTGSRNAEWLDFPRGKTR